jgi:hypothetical protein
MYIISLYGAGLVNNKMLTIRAPENELEILARYAVQTRRTKTEIVRELLRSLERKLERPMSARPASRKSPTKPKGAPGLKPEGRK